MTKIRLSVKGRDAANLKGFDLDQPRERTGVRRGLETWASLTIYRFKRKEAAATKEEGSKGKPFDLE